MDRNEVYTNLCYYDNRNPDGYYSPGNKGLLWDNEDEIILPRQDDCYCDNCFYSRDDLALEIIRLLDLVQ